MVWKFQEKISDENEYTIITFNEKDKPKIVTAQLKNISDEIHVGIPVVLHVDFDENVSGEVVFNINNMNYTVTINESMSVDYIWTPSNDGDVNISGYNVISTANLPSSLSCIFSITWFPSLMS